jgi:hypothetical protein
MSNRLSSGGSARPWHSTNMEHLVSIDRQPARATLRSFGLAIGAICFIQAAYSLSASVGAIGLAAMSLGLAYPSLYRWPYILLGTLTFPLRWLVAFSVIAALYFAVITPVACVVRVTRRLSRPAADTGSAWQACAPRGDKLTYFRQF